MSEQPAWRLTQAERRARFDADPGESAEGYDIMLCNAQAKKLVEWGMALCVDHSYNYQPRFACSGCQQQLRKDVGLDA